MNNKGKPYMNASNLIFFHHKIKDFIKQAGTTNSGLGPAKED
jgi:hypothetical protein